MSLCSYVVLHTKALAHVALAHRVRLYQLVRVWVKRFFCFDRSSADLLFSSRTHAFLCFGKYNTNKVIFHKLCLCQYVRTNNDSKYYKLFHSINKQSCRCNVLDIPHILPPCPCGSITGPSSARSGACSSCLHVNGTGRGGGGRWGGTFPEFQPQVSRTGHKSAVSSEEDGPPSAGASEPLNTKRSWTLFSAERLTDMSSSSSVY